MNVFLDTSAWILSLNGKLNPDINNELKGQIVNNQVYISEIVILELLQGCKTAKEKNNLETLLYSLEIFPITKDIWKLASNIGFEVRKMGYTIPTVDIIIASLCEFNKITLLHKDKHYLMIKECRKNFQHNYIK